MTDPLGALVLLAAIGLPSLVIEIAVLTMIVAVLRWKP